RTSVFRNQVIRPSDLEQERVALATAGADRREAETTAVAAQLVHHRAHDPRARGPDRMPKRDRAAVHVHALLVGAEQLRRVEHDRRERLVQLDALDVVDRLPRLPPASPPRLRGGPREIGEVVRDVALRDDRREHLEPAPLRELLTRDDGRARPVVHTRRVAGGRRALRVENRLERWELLQKVVPLSPPTPRNTPNTKQ